MRRSLCAYLQDVLDAAGAIREFTNGFSFETFTANDLTRSAVERKFEIIGEALKQAAENFSSELSAVPELKEIIGQRNWIAHGYFNIDPLILWRTIEDDLARLLSKVEKLKETHCVEPQ